MTSHAIVDTHAHICDTAFDFDRAKVLERAKEAGVSAIIAVSETLADAQRNLQLAEIHPLLRPAVGLYPGHLNLEHTNVIMAFIRNHRSKIYAIGEVGLDHWVIQENAERELQRSILSSFIDVARELELPLNIHSRSAGRHVIELLLQKEARKVQLHAFDGKASTAIPAIEAGFFFSIPPSVVRSPQKQKLVKQLPLTGLLVESDSPVLGPSPEARNEPANVIIAIKAIAEIKNINQEEVIETLAENARQLFGDLFVRS